MSQQCEGCLDMAQRIGNSLSEGTVDRICAWKLPTGLSDTPKHLSSMIQEHAVQLGDGMSCLLHTSYLMSGVALH